MLTAAPAFAASVPVPRPNILLIVADDLGFADLDSYSDLAAHAQQQGGFWLEDQLAGAKRSGEGAPAPGRSELTRNVDSLAAEGVRFTSFYANAPSCSPTRASILTGMYPHRFGLTQAILPNERPNHTAVDAGIPGTSDETPTLPARLRDAGYRTAHVGKWHIGQSLAEHMPVAKGFDEFFGYLGAGTNRGQSESEMLCFSRQLRLAPGDAVPQHEPCLKPGPCPEGAWCGSENVKGFLTETTTVRAIEFLERHVARGDDEPFFLSLAYAMPHPAGDMVNPSGVPARVRKRFADTPMGGYAAMVAWLDENLGRLLEAVHAQGLYEDTIVIFTSDNGGVGWYRNDGQFGTHHECIGPGNPETGLGSVVHDNCNGRLRGAKHFLFEGGIRVPFLLRWPARFDPTSPFDNGTVMATMDLMPTLLDLAGAEVPTGIDGEIMDLAVRGWQREAPLFWFEPGQLTEGERNVHPQFAVRFRDWKLIRMPATGDADPMLFRLSREVSGVTQVIDDDPRCRACVGPDEEQNLAPSGEHRGVMQWMLRAYAAWIRQFPASEVHDPWLEKQLLSPAVPYDFNGDGKADLLFENVEAPRPGLLGIATLDGVRSLTVGSPTKFGREWTLVGTGRFDASGRSTIVSRMNEGAEVGLFRFLSLGPNGMEKAEDFFRSGMPRAYELIGLADFNGDFVDDFLFWEPRGEGGAVHTYLVDNDVRRRHFGLTARLGSGESVVALADLNGDGRDDWVVQSPPRAVETTARLHGFIVDASGEGIERRTALGRVPGGYRFVGTGRFDGDERADLLFHTTQGGNSELRVAPLALGGEGTRAETFEIELAEGQTPVAIGDFDGRQGDDLAVVQTAGRHRGAVEILLLEPPAARVRAKGTPLELESNARIVRDGARRVDVPAP